MKSIVTGGAGFIGSHLVKALVAQGHEVHIIDNLSRNKATQLETIREIVGENVTLHKVNVMSEPEFLPDIFAGADYVFHLAALTSVPGSIEEPYEYHMNNVVGTINVLEASRKANVKKFVFSSSGAVYGDTKAIPTSEADATEPLSPYALDKLMGEELCLMYSRVYGLPTISLRYFNVYGEGMHETGAYVLAIAIFLKQLREGKPLTVTGDGLQTRDFVHVSDVASANIAAAESEYGSGNIFNVGSGEETTVNEIAKLIAPHNIEHVEARLEPRRACADIDAIKSMLNWEPKIKVKEEVPRMVSKQSF